MIKLSFTNEKGQIEHREFPDALTVIINRAENWMKVSLGDGKMFEIVLDTIETFEMRKNNV